ncbi:hypothetical protein [uncultured Nostoc sp.]|uniref:hypothetical protein n=1 Tax=uncultured Nostoc sp. TaxID=340711 RepID=UPI0035CBF23F
MSIPVNERYKLNVGIRKRFIKPANSYQAYGEGFKPVTKAFDFVYGRLQPQEQN